MRKVLACLVVFVVLAAPAPFVNTPVGYVPVLAYVMLMALMFAYVRILAHGVKFEAAGFDAGCYRDEQLPFKLSVRNTSFLPAVSIIVQFYRSDLFGGTGEVVERRVTLPPRANRSVDFGVKFMHVGTYQVGVREITISDAFGIFNHVERRDELNQVEVQPILHDITELDVTTDASVESKSTFSTVINDGMDYSGVREYRWGDPIKAIHWKLSARQLDANYYTRLYETLANAGMALFLDTDCPDSYDVEQRMSLFDALVESVFSIEHWACSVGLDTEIRFVDRKDESRCFEGPVGNKVVEVLERIPRIAPGTGVKALELFQTEVNNIYAQSNLVLCTSSITDALVSTLLGAKASQRFPILVAVVPPHYDQEALKVLTRPLTRLGMAHVPYCVISSADMLGKRS